MIDYDSIKEVFHLQRDRTGVIIEKIPVPLEAFRFLLGPDGNVPEPPYPACQILTMGLPLLATKDEIEVHYDEN